MTESQKPVYSALKRLVLTKSENWILDHTVLDRAQVLQSGDSIGRSEYDLFAKQLVMEKMMKTLAEWYEDPQSTTFDIVRHLSHRTKQLEKVCDHCVETQLAWRQIAIRKDESVGWYEEPSKILWTHGTCDNCNRIVSRTHMM